MIPLMACSVVSLTILIERYSTIKKARVDTQNLSKRVEDLVYCCDITRAAEVCDEFGGPVASMMSAGLRASHLGARGAERAMEEKATSETSALQNRLGILDTIITIAPLLGLLGTVTGMISSFHVISSKEGMSAPTAITGGVAEALIATATGLAIAITTLVGYNHLNDMIRRTTEDMETRGNQLLNVLEDAKGAEREIKKLSA
jgi:biopolymer transport protein ExbB